MHISIIRVVFPLFLDTFLSMSVQTVPEFRPTLAHFVNIRSLAVGFDFQKRLSQQKIKATPRRCLLSPSSYSSCRVALFPPLRSSLPCFLTLFLGVTAAIYAVTRHSLFFAPLAITFPPRAQYFAHALSLPLPLSFPSRDALPPPPHVPRRRRRRRLALSSKSSVHCMTGIDAAAIAAAAASIAVSNHGSKEGKATRLDGPLGECACEQRRLADWDGCKNLGSLSLPWLSHSFDRRIRIFLSWNIKFGHTHCEKIS